MKIFNPMITTDVKKILVGCFLGLLVLSSAIVVSSNVVSDTFVASNSYVAVVMLVLIAFFVLRGHGAFRYFLWIFAIINFVFFYMMTLVPVDADGLVIMADLHVFNQMSELLKTVLYVLFNVLQLLFIMPLVTSKKLLKYFDLAEKERKGRIVKG